ncbi:MAG: peptide deformylase [Ectothiorhodospiraceae bacterium]|nr:peptide deformylase [Ectothiorhodospiraceae bacterium]
MIRPILAHPDPRLRQPSKPVERFDDELRKLVDDMFDTMHHAEGIGLAAVQIGVHLRVAVMEVENNPQRVMINPRFEPLGSAMTMQEGCLSVPGVQDRTKVRLDHLRVQALDIEGKPYTFEARGLEAACVQHECDHMDGKLYIDHLSHLRRQRVLQRYGKARQEAGRA